MNEFQQWRNWAAGLDDVEFSRLWLALGAVMALRQPSGPSIDGIGDVWAAALRAHELSWVMPRFSDLVALRLQGSTARDWITRWDSELGTRLAKVPVRMGDWPLDEPSDAWFATLARLAPVVSLRLPSADNRMLGWPLRIAALNEDDRSVVHESMGLWPANRLARIAAASGDRCACDLLLVSGDLDALIEELQRGAVAANFVVVCLRRPLAAADFARISATTAAAHAGGFAIIEDSTDIHLAARINRFVEELSHAQRVDVAACLAFQGTPRPVLVGLGDDMARFTIRDVADRLQTRSRILERVDALPAAARSALDKVMPRPTVPASVEPESSALESMGADAAAPSGGLESFGGDAAEPVVSAPVSAPAHGMPEEAMPDFERLEAPYDHEWGGAATLVEAAEALDQAEASLPNQRFLQQESFVVQEGQRRRATKGFMVGQLALIEVHIGPHDGVSNALPDAFPENALPQELASWDLQVWLAEPEHIPAPLQGSIHLRRSGPSTTCAFEFTPKTAGPFNGRISVLYRGRVIQTAALRASVNSSDAIVADAIAPTLERVLQVKQNLSDLDRRRFDLAFVLNHAATDQPIAHAMGENRAWLTHLRVAEKTVVALNKALSNLAQTAKDYAGGLTSKKGQDLLRKLAQIGSYLHLYLVEAQPPVTGESATDDVLSTEFIQVVSTRSDAIVIPFEFIYAYGAPDDDAQLCANWREAVTQGRCAATCQHGARTFCPMGFWGLSKVIERHALQPGLAREGEVGVQSEPVAGRDTLKISGTAVFGCSKRVVDAHLDPLRQRMTAAKLNGKQAKDWKEWSALVGAGSPSLLIALAHSDGSGFSATVEIGGQAIKTIGITPAHIRSQAAGAERPLVALLGCDMAGTGDDYANPVAVFSARGAAAVIGTIATVLAEDSADVAARLMHGLTFADPAQTRRLGEAMRDLKRTALLDGELMPLCLVSFGDADWLLSN